MLLETDDNDAELRSFVYGRGLDEVLLMADPNGTDYYYLHDHLNSVVAVVDEDGDILERYEYDAYGKPSYYEGDYSELEATLIGNPYYFTGRRIDFVGHSAWMIQYNRNRFLDYDTGCRLNQDPITVWARFCLRMKYISAPPPPPRSATITIRQATSSKPPTPAVRLSR